MNANGLLVVEIFLLCLCQGCWLMLIFFFFVNQLASLSKWLFFFYNFVRRRKNSYKKNRSVGSQKKVLKQKKLKVSWRIWLWWNSRERKSRNKKYNLTRGFKFLEGKARSLNYMYSTAIYGNVESHSNCVLTKKVKRESKKILRIKIYFFVYQRSQLPGNDVNFRIFFL